ncbi:MAG: hypothetical protein ACRC2B_11945, partial [Rubrivivax sp.]
MDEPTPSTAAPTVATAPAPAVAAPKRAHALRGLHFSLVGYLLSVAAALALVVGSVWWLLSTEAGTAWLLARVPVVQVSGVTGALFGDFEAQRVEMPLPGEGARLQMQDLGWKRLRLHSAGAHQWLRISLDELRIGRIDLHLSDEPSADIAAPTSLALPIGLEVASVRIDELHVDGLDMPLRDLRARLSLGADDGATHRLDDLQLAWDRLRLTGRATVATAGKLNVDASAEMTQQFAASGDWNATALLSGPLAQPRLQLRLRAQSAPSRPAQTLDASATLRPFAAWPLGELQARARALDLSALNSTAPSTALDLDASASTHGLDQPAAVSLALNNRAPGRWNEGRLPVRELELELQGRPDDPSQLELKTFDAELGTAQSSAGRLSGSGSWNPATWQLDVRLSALHPALLDVRAPAMRLDGQLRLDGTSFDSGSAQTAQVNVRGNLDGRLLERGPAQPVQLRLDARFGALRI